MHGPLNVKHPQWKRQFRRNKPSIIPPVIKQLGSYYRRMKSILLYIPSGPYTTCLFPLEPILEKCVVDYIITKPWRLKAIVSP